ncbi:MAG: CPBP family intramembrane metalloprotease [Chloroflexi bacterium]|nr:MAG: CPBP family intramembrane metalloprotease [Chloroflexota bacterium]
MNPSLSNRTNIGRIVTYLALTFGLSTIFYVKIIAGGEGYAPWVLPLMLCPSVSAILTKLIFDRNLKGLGWRPGPAKWLGLAYLLPILYGAVVYGIVWLVGQGGFTTDVVTEMASGLGMAESSVGQMVAVYTLFLATIVFLRSGLPGALGEELGWRGFLFPELQRMTSFTTASLIGGVVWALYHLPLILFSDYHSTAPIAFQVVVFFISTIAYTFVNNWLRARSGSVWPAVVLHASHNIFFEHVYDPLMVRYPLTDFFVTEFGVGLMVINVLMALYVWAHRRELDPKPEATMTMTAKLPMAAD